MSGPGEIVGIRILLSVLLIAAMFRGCRLGPDRDVTAAVQIASRYADIIQEVIVERGQRPNLSTCCGTPSAMRNQGNDPIETCAGAEGGAANRAIEEGRMM
jgi:hypothetical protein